MEQSAQQSKLSESWKWFSQAITQHDTFAGYFQPFVQMVLPKWTTDAYRAQVVDIRNELSDMFTLVLKPSPTIFDKSWKTFVPGQYIELMVEKDGARMLRCFSISSSPDYYAKTGLIELSIREQPQGRITPWLKTAMKKGQALNLSEAKGDFVLTPEKQATPLLMIAGGSGVTPFRSMLQQLYRQAVMEVDIQVLYYSRNQDHIVFEEEFRNFQKHLPNVTIHFIDSEVSGFVSSEHIQTYCPDFISRTPFICGPAPMIKMARSRLQELGVEPEKIMFEYFGAAPIELEGAHGAVSFATSGLATASDAENQKTLLQQAEESGLEPVSGCRIGVCHQCICQKKSGVVFNSRTGEYSDTGPGEVQLCVSVAVGDVVLDL